MKLYAHQKEILDADPKKTGLFLGTGSGKTRIALLLARGTTLVIAPKTQVEDGNWQREHAKLAYEHTKVVGEPVVITFDKFKAAHQDLPRFDTVIVDEAHGMLGVTAGTCQRQKKTIPKASQRYEALRDYVDRTNPERIYLCTATIIKSPMTVWAAASILLRENHYFDIDNFRKFREAYYIRLPMPGREVWAPRNESSAKDKLAKIVRDLGHVGRLEDFFDVPDQTFRTEHIELTGAQKARIKDMALEYPDPIVRAGKIHQIENGCLAGDEFNRPELFTNGKVERLLELAIEFPRMVVFAKYRAQITQIEAELKHAGYTVWTLTGETKDRQAVIAAANAQDGILVCQAQISAGWEVPQTPVVVFASRTYSFVDYDQALGRVQRANNIKKNLYINLVVKGGVDEAVDRSLSMKQDFSERVYADQNL